MKNLDYDNLINIIDTSIKKSFVAFVDNKNKPHPNVANLGAKTGTIVKLERQGEYYGIAVEVLTDIKPLLTDYMVKKILKFLKKEDYLNPLKILQLDSLDRLMCVLDNWFQVATTDYHNEIKHYDKSTSVKKYIDWIQTVRSDPLPDKIKVVEIGQNQTTSESVLPAEWIDREFESGCDLHNTMNKLESRIAKPPVTYACIYSMVVTQKDNIITNIDNIKYDNIWYINLIDKEISSKLTKKINPSKLYSYVLYGTILIGFVLTDILEPKNETNTSKNKEVGILISRMQKAIRRGGFGRAVLEETIDKLNNSPNYNLPEHSFMRVSASKQLVWRLFISILEDCGPYNKSGLQLIDLILLVLITQICTEYKFTPTLLKLIKNISVLAQFNDDKEDLFNWRSFPETNKKSLKLTKSPFHNAIYMALENVIMMQGDSKMLRKYYSAPDDFEEFTLPFEYYNDKKICKDITLASIDHHCKPYIILYYQACIPISMTTKQISSYIWDISSSLNVRSGKKDPKPDSILRSIQSYFLTKPETKKVIDVKESDILQKQKVTTNASRTSFLILFGQKYRYNGKDIVMAGDTNSPLKVKISNEWIFSADINILNAYGSKTINLKQINPPTGFKWSGNKIQTAIKEGIPYINNKKVNFFDGSSVLVSAIPDVQISVKKSIQKMIIDIFSGLDIDFDTILFLRTNSIKKLCNWELTKSELKLVNYDLIRAIYTKIFNQLDSLIIIGPVDRSGNKTTNSISYLFEGKIWAGFNLFCYLYPGTFKPHGTLNFTVNNNTSGYVHVINTLQAILFKPNVKLDSIIPKIKTKLWPHQIESAQKITHGFKNGAHGHGDSSDVGSGKTLVSLAVGTELIRNEIELKEVKGFRPYPQPMFIYSGILVLLPGNALIKTWTDELTKHTKGFDVRYHEPKKKIININLNTIVVSTMGKIRDHPINHNWLLTIIDECLTTQNRNALWTQEAWKQGLMSKHLLMLSATFFRAKFLGLYYMLQMLQTGLPEKKEYLDAILLESIVSKVSKTRRKWKTRINYFELDESDRKAYEKIESKNLDVEIQYAKLNSFLTTTDSVTKSVSTQLKKMIKQLEKDDKRCLIYARSKHEAKIWSEHLSIGIYPQKQTHTIITVTDGTYGLNDLVQYNCILMIPPAPDRIPQMKGRLDRPGQTENKLFIEYIVLKNTIEEGLLLRIDICNNFVNQYIMPLSKFYEISVKHQEYVNKKID